MPKKTVPHSIENIKACQKVHFDRAWSSKKFNYEQNYFHDHFRAIPFITLKALLTDLNLNLDGMSVLIASCGSGTDVHYLTKLYNARFTVTDLTKNALDTTLNNNNDLVASAQDTENLAFVDSSFDYAFIAAGLHHLPRPTVGLYELLRVAKYGVIAIEPNDCWLMRLATRLKIATEIETSGNYVYRFSAWDVKRISHALFCRCYHKRLFAIHRIAKSWMEFNILRSLNFLANMFVPALGNYIVFMIMKR